MLPTVGYKWNSEHTAVSERTQQQESHWRSWLRGCRLDEASHFGLSLTALRKRKATEAELLGAEQEHWFSSACVLVLMAFWPSFRRRAADKVQCRTAAKLFLSSTCSRDSLLAVPVSSVSPSDAAQCVSFDRPENGLCRCMTVWLLGIDTAPQHEGDIYSYFADLLVGLAGIRECLTCRAHLGSLCKALGKVIDSARSTWGQALGAKNADRLVSAKGKRCRVDPHTRALVTDAASAHSQSQGDAQALQSMGDLSPSSRAEWEGHRLAQHMAASHPTCKARSTVSSALDASRIGEPALDLLAHVLWHHRSQGLVSLPPAVLVRSSIWPIYVLSYVQLYSGFSK